MLRQTRQTRQRADNNAKVELKKVKGGDASPPSPQKKECKNKRKKNNEDVFWGEDFNPDGTKMIEGGNTKKYKKKIVPVDFAEVSGEEVKAPQVVHVTYTTGLKDTVIGFHPSVYAGVGPQPTFACTLCKEGGKFSSMSMCSMKAFVILSLNSVNLGFLNI